MNDRASRLFAGPMPFQVRWLDDGSYRCATTFERDVADRIFDELVAARANPTIWLGGMNVRELSAADLPVPAPSEPLRMPEFLK